MKTYDEQLDEAADNYEYKVSDFTKDGFKAGAAFGLAWQKQREEKLIASLRNMIEESTHGDYCRHIIYQAIRNCDCHKADFETILKSHEENGD